MTTAVRLLLAVPLACLAYVGLFAALGGALRVIDPTSIVGNALGNVLVWISPLALGWLALLVLWAGCVLLLGRVGR